MAASSATAHAHTNRLAKEESPYLLQHQHNPVSSHTYHSQALHAGCLTSSRLVYPPTLPTWPVRAPSQQAHSCWRVGAGGLVPMG